VHRARRMAAMFPVRGRVAALTAGEPEFRRAVPKVATGRLYSRGLAGKRLLYDRKARDFRDLAERGGPGLI
jgi:hypothetical protein